MGSRPREETSVDFIRKFLPGGMERYIEGIEFPIRKEEALAKLEQNGAPGMVVSQLRERLPEGEYQSPQEVVDALKRGGSGSS